MLSCRNLHGTIEQLGLVASQAGMQTSVMCARGLLIARGKVPLMCELCASTAAHGWPPLQPC